MGRVARPAALRRPALGRRRVAARIACRRWCPTSTVALPARSAQGSRVPSRAADKQHVAAVAVRVGRECLGVCVELRFDSSRRLRATVKLQVESDLAIGEQVAAEPVRAHRRAGALLGLLFAEPAIEAVAGQSEASLDQPHEEPGDLAAVLQVRDRKAGRPARGRIDRSPPARREKPQPLDAPALLRASEIDTSQQILGV